MKLTEKLDLLMKERGISVADLAREADVPYTTIKSLYDKGYENVKLSTLKKIAKYFNCSLDYIADDDVIERDNIITIAAHFDGEELTGEEQEQLDDYIKFLLSRRKE